MINLVTTDNNNGILLPELYEQGLTPKDSQYKDLGKIANVTVGELAQNNSSLLVFPKILGEHCDDIDELPIFTMSGTEESLENVKITTGNLMGFIGCGETQLEITSRFTQKGNEDYFLHYMLQKVFAINLFDLSHTTSKEGQFDFLIYLFPALLKRAVSQGIFKTYQSYKKNNANVKGVIDVSRHIRENNPFKGNVSYSTRERTFDNYLLELIRHTIEVIKTKPNGKTVLSNDDETKKAVSLITELTEGYNFRDREMIISKNSKPINHPYFTAYKPLQKLCLSILRHQKLKYGNDSKKIYGILFDGAWLWEEYLATILKEIGFKHPKNKENSGGIRMFDNYSTELSFDKNFRKIYPDFYKPNEIILDAKYKRLNGGVGRDDLYQVVSYMHTMHIDKGGFLYPNDFDEDNKSVTYKLAGYGGTISVIGLNIPQIAQSSLDFKKQIQEEEVFLIERIKTQEAL